MFELHAVIINKKNVKLDDAKKMAMDIIKDKNKTFYRETMDSYRFRNIPKTKFSEFRSKIINPNITLIFGKLKKV
jgi:ABC-type antimicrobial peptide transport system ATPase subunit